ncbi:hypothetical protein ACLGIH_01010 [Streptomyces sp. HMX87]|uniref:hypothetical protein n=1 Tax=Streptomyces sp. HMX87 TaxID=3390849 RepID=UPI003A847856
MEGDQEITEAGSLPRHRGLHPRGLHPCSRYEAGTASIVHLVRVGRALGLARATFPHALGIVSRPLAGTPLTWRLVLGWHAAAQPVATVNLVLEQAVAAHRDALKGAVGTAT